MDIFPSDDAFFFRKKEYTCDSLTPRYEQNTQTLFYS
jgi:hypothetical protein